GDNTAGVSRRYDIGVDDICTKRLGLVLGRELADRAEILQAPAHRRHQRLSRSSTGRTGQTEVDPLALEILDAGDAGITTGDNGHRFAVERKHRPQPSEAALGSLGRWPFH